MTDPRFIVTEFVGIPIGVGYQKGSAHEQASYYVQDTLYNYAVVRTYENGRRAWTRTRRMLREAADKECARLNEWWEYERKRG